jgi:hypothetical protein
LCNLTAGRKKKKKKKKTMTKKNYTLLIQEDDVLVTYEELALLLFLLTDVANFFDFMENTIVLFLGEDFLIDRTENFHLELAQEEEEEEEGIGSWWWWVAMSSLRQSGSFEVLRALDRARTQWYHFTTIIIAGMGFFTDAYDLFCISTVTRLLGRLYYYNPATGQPGQLPPNVSAAVNGVALCGTLCGQLFFGWLGDRLGRKKAYGSTLVLMILTSIASGMSFGQSAKAVMSTLCEFFFFPNTPELSSSFYVVLAILLQCCSSLCC